MRVRTMCPDRWHHNKIWRRAVRIHRCSRQTVSVCHRRIVRRWQICPITIFRAVFHVRQRHRRRCHLPATICSSQWIIRRVLMTFQLPLQPKPNWRRKKSCHLNYRRHSKRWQNYRTRRLVLLQSKFNHLIIDAARKSRKQTHLLKCSYHSIIQITRFRLTTMAHQRETWAGANGN